MRLSDGIERALGRSDALERPVEVAAGGARARVDVTAVDGLGVRVRSVRVEVDGAAPVTQRAVRVAEACRVLGEAVAPVEVDAALGGAVLRGPLRRDVFHGVDLDPAGAEVRRWRVTEGERQPAEFTLTREQLGRLVDDLEAAQRQA